MNNEVQVVFSEGGGNPTERINPSRAEAQIDGTQKSQIVDAEGDVAEVDEYSNSLEIIDTSHDHVHEGRMFDVCELVSLTIGNNRDYLLIT
jgi:hypothetical protein